MPESNACPHFRTESGNVIAFTTNGVLIRIAKSHDYDPRNPATIKELRAAVEELIEDLRESQGPVYG